MNQIKQILEQIKEVLGLNKSHAKVMKAFFKAKDDLLEVQQKVLDEKRYKEYDIQELKKQISQLDVEDEKIQKSLDLLEKLV